MPAFRPSKSLQPLQALRAYGKRARCHVWKRLNRTSVDAMFVMSDVMGA